MDIRIFSPSFFSINTDYRNNDVCCAFIITVNLLHCVKLEFHGITKP